MASNNIHGDPFPELETTDRQEAQIFGPGTPGTDRAAQTCNEVPANIDLDNETGAQETTTSSSMSGRIRQASGTFAQSSIPQGFLAATGGLASSVFSNQKASKNPSTLDATGTPASATTYPEPIPENDGPVSTTSSPRAPCNEHSSQEQHKDEACHITTGPAGVAPFANGYHFPPSHTFVQSFKLSMIAYWNYVRTPLGFLITIYGLNVVAWGGMLFLLLCNACKPSLPPTTTVILACCL